MKKKVLRKYEYLTTYTVFHTNIYIHGSAIDFNLLLRRILCGQSGPKSTALGQWRGGYKYAYLQTTLLSYEESQWDRDSDLRSFITKTRLFKYIENFTTKNWKF